ncbi:GlxA family transcriptional regulator [Vibrio fluvialis]
MMTHNIGVIVFPGFNIMGLSMMAAFELVNTILNREVYHVKVLSESGGMIPSSVGVMVASESMDATSFDTVCVAASSDANYHSPQLETFIRQQHRAAKRIIAPCTGAFILAQSGILNGKRATTHWFFARDLQQKFPQIRVEEDAIYIESQAIWTSAGMSAALDLALAIIAKDHDEELAKSVARKLVIYHRRSGGQSQFSELLELEPKSDRIQKVLAYAKAHLNSHLTVETLADVANLSSRQFSRAFQSETGVSPAKAIERLRVEVAKDRIVHSALSLDVIANEVGFFDRERMRRAFVRILGQPPQALKRAK